MKKRDDIPKGIPVFIDEISTGWLSYIKEKIIKHPEATCENIGNDTRPMLLMASNSVLEPEEATRKRMIYLKFDASLPSYYDKTAMETRGKRIISSMGTALYREYLKKYMSKCLEFIDKIETEELDESYYPDVLNASSKVLVDIVREYSDGLVPPYIQELTWHKDYCLEEIQSAVEILVQEYKMNPKAFTVKNNQVFFSLSSDSESNRKMNALKNTLPAEFEPKVSAGRDEIVLTILREPFEKFTNKKLKKSIIRSILERLEK